MRSPIGILLLLLGGCGEPAASELTFPAGGLQEFLLRLPAGSITVRQPRGDEDPGLCLVRLRESGGSGPAGAEERFRVRATAERIRIETRRNEEGLRLDVEVVAPAGVGLDLVVREGPITIEGAYASVTATSTKGSVRARLRRAAGGQLKTFEGDVDVTLDRGPLTGGLTAETLRGNASLRLPADFRGPVQLESGSGEIDLGEKSPFAIVVDADRRSARGFAGEPLSVAERETAARENRWPPGAWARTQRGRVSLRVGPGGEQESSGSPR